jgi:hypothetical protein
LNYFAHALPFLEADPHFIAGTAVPDWMSVADRRVRVRAKLAQPVADSSPDPLVRHVARGALQHLADDGWFHATRGFAEVTGDLSRRFRESLGPDDPMRCGFLGHVVTELLLDAALVERSPSQLDRYYERLSDLDCATVESAVNQISRGATDRLAPLIPLFRRERFLYDYADDARLLYRLNRVLERVKLSPITDDCLGVLSDARPVVRQRATDLLPSDRYRWPDSKTYVSLIQPRIKHG